MYQYTLIFVVGLWQIIPVLSSLDKDTDCGVTKGCFPDCRSADCDYMVTWKNVDQDSIQFTLLLVRDTLPPYVAIGFSDDYRMGDDSVVGCVFDSNQCYSSFNDGTKNHALNPPSKGIRAFNIAHTDDIINCTFTRQNTLKSPNSRFYDIKQNKYILMFVYGKTELKKDDVDVNVLSTFNNISWQNGYFPTLLNDVGCHPWKRRGHFLANQGFLAIDSHHMIPYASNIKVDFTLYQIVQEYKWNSPIIKLHGMLMSTAWLLFSCVGVVTARYNKLLLKRYRLFNTQIWFQVHRTAMMIVMCLTLSGFVAIFVEIGGYSQLNPPSGLEATSAHPILGIIITSLALLNVIGGFARPGTEHKLRWMFNWVHFSSGILLQVLAFSNILIGYQMQRAYLPAKVLYIGIAQIAITVLVFTCLQVHRWRVKKAQDTTFVGLADPFVLNSSKTVSEVYGYILLSYGILMLTLSMVTVGLIGSR